MPKLRRLSGDEIISIMAGHGLSVYSQRGSHVKLRRVTASGAVQTLTVPRHHELDSGTLVAIFRQACRFVPSEELRGAFYTN